MIFRIFSLKNTRKFLRELRVTFSIAVRTIKLMSKLDNRVFGAFVNTSVLGALLPYLPMYFTAEILNILAESVGEGSLVDRERLVIVFVLGSISILANQIHDRKQRSTNQLVYQVWARHTPTLVADKLARLDLEIHENSEFQTFLNRVRDGADGRPGEYTFQLRYLIQNSIGFISAAVIIIRLNPIFTVLFVLISIPEFFLSLRATDRKWGIWEAESFTKKRYYHTRSLVQGDWFLKEVRILNLTDHFLRYLSQLLKRFFERQREIIVKYERDSILAFIPDLLAKLGVSAWLILQVVKGALTIGEFSFYTSVIERFTNSFKNLLGNVSYLYEHQLYMKDLYKLMDMENKIVTKAGATVIPMDKVPTIEFKDVWFKYPGSKNYIFKEFNLVVRSGDDIAIVGENGAGKTTFVKLIARLYDIDKGAILINGVDIRDIDLKSWYEHLGVLFQDFNRYEFSVRENIEFGRIRSKPKTKKQKRHNMKKVIYASKQAGAHQFLKDYPKGYETQLDKGYEDGIEPSGGQWQKIALARAFYREANILILDEPTSAIDAVAEYEIFKKIASLQEYKTTIIISHRFSTVRKADRIIVLDKGHIVEDGSHQELMEVKGLYRKMFEIQAQGYK